jgi:hypothetical protein
MIVKEEDSRIVQFSHFSVKEFLTANRLADHIKDVSRYHIRLEAAHTILALACLSVLLRLDDQVDHDNIKNFPLAEYAARYWATHARFENASSRIKDGMERLFDADRPHFATWLWIYNEDRGIPFGFTMWRKKPEAVPLYYAAMLGFRDLAEHLIAEHPEHVNARGGASVTPMHVAAREGHANILSLLLEHGTDLHDRCGTAETLLHVSARRGTLEAGQFLLDRGADINAQDEEDWTPLFTAVVYRRVQFARMLLERGARINAQTTNGSAPLHHAVDVGDVQLVRLLLEYGADVNVRDSSGKTPTQRATQQDIVELLSEYCANQVLTM